MKGCRNCTNWQALDEFLDRIDPATNNQNAQLGQCRRYAPQPLAPEAGGSGEDSAWDARWPRAASDDWCGEWDPRLD